MTTERKIKAAITVVLVFTTFWVWIANRGDRAAESPDPRREPTPDTVVPKPAPTPEIAEAPATEKKPESFDLTGIVLDAAGDRPVAGARVELISGGTLDGYSELSAEPHLTETITGEDGRFRLSVPPDRLVTVIVAKEGYTEARESMKLAAARELTLRIATGGIVRGRVLDPDGRPVVGAVVYAIPAGAPEMLLLSPETTVTGSDGTWEALRTETGAGGGYEIRGLILGVLYHLRGTGGGVAPSEDVEARATPGEVVVMRTLRLRRHGVVLIHVLDPAGKPAPVATGWIDWGRPIFPKRIPLTEPGLFRLERLTPGPHVLRIVDAGAPPVMAKFAVVPDTTIEVSVRLEAGVSVSGVVRDDLGEPVPGARVEVRRPLGIEHQDLPESTGKTVTDAEGRFRIDGLRPGPHVLLPHAKDLEGIHHGPFMAPVDDLEVKVLRRARVRARLVLPDGAAAPETIGLSYSTRPRNAEIWGSGGRGWRGQTHRWSDGSFELTVPACPVEIWMRVAGHAPVRREARVAPGGEIDLGDIPLETGVTLTGRVTDVDGRPVAGAEVSVAMGPFDSESTESSASGDVTLPHLPAGKVVVVVEAEAFLDAEVPLDLSGTLPTLAVALSRGVRLEGTVVDAAGHPVAGLDLHVFDPEDEEGDDRYDYVYTGMLGTFTTRLHAGTYTVEVRRGETLLVTVKTTLEEGKTTKLRIDLPPE